MSEEEWLRYLPSRLRHPAIANFIKILIAFGAIYTGLVGLRDLIFGLIDLVIPTVRQSINMITAIEYHGISIGWLWGVSFDIIVIFAFFSGNLYFSSTRAK
jgi:hypothetical protein